MDTAKLISKLKPATRKGQLADLSLGVIVTLVTLFVGLYMISKVSAVASINNTSDFYNTFQTLITNSRTIYDVLILVIIIVALGVAIITLRGFGGGSASVPATV